MSESICRWGFLGAADIARKNWKAVQLSGNGRVAAVASRDRDRAARFISECGGEVPQPGDVRAIKGYDALLGRDDIDAVYIPLPTGVRKEWVIKAAAAGKHVLCEKPVAVHESDAKEMIEACRKAGVQFMDGVMFDHSQRLNRVRELVGDRETFGELRRIQTHFSFCGDESFVSSNIRAATDLEPHGCLGDLGWYCIRFTLRMMSGEMPKAVSARVHTWLGQDRLPDGSWSAGVPGQMSGEFYYDHDVTAGFFCSFLSSNQQTATVSGSLGYLTLDDFVLPLRGGQSAWRLHRHDLRIDNCRWNFTRRTIEHAVDEFDSGEPDSQEVAMVRRLAEIANSGTLDPDFPEISLATQRILDTCRSSAERDGEVVKFS